MCGFFSTTLTLLVDNDSIVDLIVDQLVGIFDSFASQEDVNMCLKQFLPEIRSATQDIRPLPAKEKKHLFGNAIGTVAKLFYAFVWQVC